ncbi:MAG: thiamine phosphate synthase [candidate division NC10 bacterium]|nr:thiamine phosphate synthase [candidate division NC10 bacterium]
MLRSLTLCVITDPKLAPGRDHVAIAKAALAGGADMIQLRDKAGDLRELLPQARAIQALCRSQGAIFIVNDRLDLALAAGADGVHVGQEDLVPEKARRVLGAGEGGENQQGFGHAGERMLPRAGRGSRADRARKR